ncbi:unnamed protein product [Fusarium venenatum]|uniref:Uncharacterized protein n=1 Tax=Fusarium venenatum TaxID=56646 RepID=A0A2L2SQ19_9HYPO|nr:uncharacterized protein FVRRES_11432 [Fusarium venenatum]CEI38741.1 unnamed protein product [Fusarium venenatum]
MAESGGNGAKTAKSWQSGHCPSSRRFYWSWLYWASHKLATYCVKCFVARHLSHGGTSASDLTPFLVTSHYLILLQEISDGFSVSRGFRKWLMSD